METFAPLMDNLSIYGPDSSEHPIVGVCAGTPAFTGSNSASNCTVLDFTNFNPTLNFFYNYFADKWFGYDSLTDMTLWPNILVATMSIFNHTFIFSLWFLVVSILFISYLAKFDGIIKK